MSEGFDPIVRYWRTRDNRSYDESTKRSGRIDAITRMAELARPHLSVENAASIELGCGTGLFAEIVGVRSIVGVDASPSMAAQARRRMDVVWERDISELELEMDTFDNIVSMFVMDDYRSEAKTSFFSTIHKALKPSGRFFFAAYSPNDGYMGRIERVHLKDGSGSFTVHVKDEQFYQNVLSETGFTIENIELVNSMGILDKNGQKTQLQREFILIKARK